MFHFLQSRLAVSLALALGGALATQQVAAGSFCATPPQVQQVREFYRNNAMTMPTIASRKLGLAEAIVVSGLPPEQAASAPGKDFALIWEAMTRWKEATFLIMKGANVFEVLSGIGKVARSKTSAYTNIEYVHPMRGHLRPDLYESIYAVSLPGKDGEAARGILFYDAQGASVFGVFMSGETSPPASELAKFDEVMELVRSRAPVCGAPQS
ncbi:MAG: ChuX/HutX family heme-like substrate-binding protein [Steroidobacteraceae bacterium]